MIDGRYRWSRSWYISTRCFDYDDDDDADVHDDDNDDDGGCDVGMKSKNRKE
jgi:hypothetical protein